jgi:4-hydroxy-tetrahydrodipicolinate reductase
MLRIGVVGAAGRMGRQVCEAVAAEGDLELVAAVDPAGAGQPLRSLAGPVVPDLTVVADLDALVDAGVQVAVDFTLAAAARVQLPWYAAHGLHAVVGTTGLSDEDLAAAMAAFAASSANAVVASNFAIGAALLVRFCELAAPVMDGVEVIELHHDEKRDAPSGTAMHTAERIAEARAAAGAGPFRPDPTTEVVVAGARGGAVDGIHVHSVRLPGMVAHEEVIFGALGQSLTMRHDAYDRRSFMPGVLLAIRLVSGRAGLTVGLGPLLGF